MKTSASFFDMTMMHEVEAKVFSWLEDFLKKNEVLLETSGQQKCNYF